ncbi:hypothetical protein FIBSPDRAFT_859502 [Athelia psychrophila]|uniref:Uncharacterized protein n=1 Tax=Athelia psychrophila TaxID=1759441 RepID=A0A166L0A5_9AGAM|nr:hypothetical protein FIBSPDRAFT_859502 [Fibularhizoctonia sp. CBS 109695]
MDHISGCLLIRISSLFKLSFKTDQRVQCEDRRSQGSKSIQRKVRAAERNGMMVQTIKVHG